MRVQSKALISLLIGSLLLLGCLAGNPVAIDIDAAAVIKPDLTISYVGELPAAPFFRQYELSIPSEGELSCSTAFGDYLYYIVQFREKKSQFAKRFQIYEYNITEKKARLFYQLQDPAVLTVNELRADSKNLYWMVTAEKDYRLQRCDYSERKPVTIRRIEAGQNSLPIVPGESRDYLSLYEYDPSAKANALAVCDLKDYSVTTIPKDISWANTGSRVPIDGKEALIVTSDDGGAAFSPHPEATAEAIPSFCVRPLTDRYTNKRKRMGTKVLIHAKTR